MWKHQREQMSYYENVMRENFDWIVFDINDSTGYSRSAAGGVFVHHEPEVTARLREAGFAVRFAKRTVRQVFSCVRK